MARIRSTDKRSVARTEVAGGVRTHMRALSVARVVTFADGWVRLELTNGGRIDVRPGVTHATVVADAGRPSTGGFVVTPADVDALTAGDSAAF